MGNVYIVFENDDFSNQYKNSIEKVDKVFTSFKKARKYIIQDIKERYMDEEIIDNDEMLADIMECDYRMLSVSLNDPHAIPEEINITDGTELIAYEP